MFILKRLTQSKIMAGGIVIFGLVGIVSSYIFSSVELPSAENLRKWSKGIVLLNFNNQTQTSGFFVSNDGMIVAPYHLINTWIIFSGYFKLLAVDYNKNVYEAKILSFNDSQDLLVLKIDYAPEHWFTEFETPKEFENCIVMGYPGGWRAAISAKIIFHPRLDLIGIDEVPVEGASGSVVLSSEGKVFGMVTHRLYLGRIVPGILIKNGLLSLNKSKNNKILYDTFGKMNILNTQKK